jgi:hypothetical protein
MSAAESEVVEAIAETEEHQPEPSNEGIDIKAASESIASDLFGIKDEKEDEVTDPEPQETEEVAEEAVEEKEEVEVKEPPKSWKKEMHETWGSLTPEAQEYIELREEQMKEGIDVRKEDADLGMRMRDAFTPYDGILKKNNVDPVIASQKLMAMHIKMLTSNPEQRKQLFDQLGQSYGISNEPVDEETQNIMNNPFVKQLMDKVNHLEQSVTTSKNIYEQERLAQIEETVNAFKAKHAHFDYLEGDIADIINTGKSLEEAYKIAYRGSKFFKEDTDKELEERLEKAKEAEKKEAEKAKKAKSINVKSRDTNKAPTAPKGKMFDDMPEIMRAIKNRN